LDGLTGRPYRLLRSDFNCRGGAPRMDKSKQEQIDEIEKIEMYGDVVF
jgi:hypothetical protein